MIDCLIDDGQLLAFFLYFVKRGGAGGYVITNSNVSRMPDKLHIILGSTTLRNKANHVWCVSNALLTPDSCTVRGYKTRIHNPPPPRTRAPARPAPALKIYRARDSALPRARQPFSSEFANSHCTRRAFRQATTPLIATDGNFTILTLFLVG